MVQQKNCQKVLHFLNTFPYITKLSESLCDLAQDFFHHPENHHHHPPLLLLQRKGLRERVNYKGLEGTSSLLPSFLPYTGSSEVSRKDYSFPGILSSTFFRLFLEGKCHKIVTDFEENNVGAIPAKGEARRGRHELPLQMNKRE